MLEVLAEFTCTYLQYNQSAESKTMQSRNEIVKPANGLT